MTFEEWWSKRKYHSLQWFADAWIKKPCKQAWNAAMTELYTIATKTDECHGHGSYSQELRICKEGGLDKYNRREGEFPPVFKRKKAAEQYLKSLQFSYDKCVVPIKMLDA